MSEMPTLMFSWVLFSYLNYENIKKYPNYPDCAAPVDLFPLTLFLNLQLLNTAQIFLLMRVCIKFWIRVILCVLICFPIIFMVSLPLFLISLFKSPNCMGKPFLYVNVFILTILNIFSIISIYFVLKVLIDFLKKKIRKNKLKNLLKNIYKQIYNKKYNIEKILKDYKDVIESFPFSENENAILKDKFCLFCENNQEGLEDGSSCIICMGEFEKGELVCAHPSCKHVFHYECCIIWIREKRCCPICKVPTRTSMIMELRKGSGEILSKRDKNLVGDEMKKDDLE